MVELTTAVIAAAATFLTSVGWQTLRRRVREHAALVKDLPPNVASPLMVVLEKEVHLLARRAERRLANNRQVSHLTASAGALVVVAFLLLLAAVTLDVPSEPQTALYWACVGVSALAAGLLFRARFVINDVGSESPSAVRSHSA